MHDVIGEAIGLALGGVAGLAHGELGLGAGAAAALLHRVRHLVGEQVGAVRLVGLVLASAEVNVLTSRKRARAEPSRHLFRRSAGMDADRREVGSQAALERRLLGSGQGRAARGRCGVGLGRNALELQTRQAAWLLARDVRSALWFCPDALDEGSLSYGRSMGSLGLATGARSAPHLPLQHHEKLADSNGSSRGKGVAVPDSPRATVGAAWTLTRWARLADGVDGFFQLNEIFMTVDSKRRQSL